MASMQESMLQKILEVVNRSDYRMFDEPFATSNRQGVGRDFRFTEQDSFDTIVRLSVTFYSSWMEFYINHSNRPNIETSYGKSFHFHTNADAKFNELLEVIEKNLAR
jgi:hypothetical protein